MLNRLLAGIGRGLRTGLSQLQVRLHKPPAAFAFAGPSPVLSTGTGPAIDLVSTPSPFVQPDRTTCGSASLVMARMINHPDYARTLLEPPGGSSSADVSAHFHADVLAMHELTNTARDETGRWQVPWPKGFGTQPWAVARRMSEPGGCGVTGSTYAVRIADPRGIDTHLDAVLTAVSAGHCVPVFVGDDLSPRHVALALDGDAEQFGFYDPSCGLRVTARRDTIRAAAMDLAGWPQFWLSILPTK